MLYLPCVTYNNILFLYSGSITRSTGYLEGHHKITLYYFIQQTCYLITFHTFWFSAQVWLCRLLFNLCLLEVFKCLPNPYQPTRYGYSHSKTAFIIWALVPKSYMLLSEHAEGDIILSFDSETNKSLSSLCPPTQGNYTK